MLPSHLPIEMSTCLTETMEHYIFLHIPLFFLLYLRQPHLMPGLINTHTHLAMSIFRGYKDDRKLMDWLENAIFPVEDKLEPDDIYWNSYLSCIEMIKSGTTTCNDMYFGMILSRPHLLHCIF